MQPGNELGAGSVQCSKNTPATTTTTITIRNNTKKTQPHHHHHHHNNNDNIRQQQRNITTNTPPQKQHPTNKTTITPSQKHLKKPCSCFLSLPSLCNLPSPQGIKQYQTQALQHRPSVVALWYKVNNTMFSGHVWIPPIPRATFRATSSSTSETRCKLPAYKAWKILDNQQNVSSKDIQRSCFTAIWQKTMKIQRNIDGTRTVIQTYEISNPEDILSAKAEFALVQL